MIQFGGYYCFRFHTFKSIPLYGTFQYVWNWEIPDWSFGCIIRERKPLSIFWWLWCFVGTFGGFSWSKFALCNLLLHCGNYLNCFMKVSSNHYKGVIWLGFLRGPHRPDIIKKSDLLEKLCPSSHWFLEYVLLWYLASFWKCHIWLVLYHGNMHITNLLLMHLREPNRFGWGHCICS